MSVTATTNHQNNQLKEVYENIFPELKETVLLGGLKYISRPFIAQVRDEYNLPNNIKIMFVGGETHEWSGSKKYLNSYGTVIDEECTVENCIAATNCFLDTNRNYDKRSRPFWNFIHHINSGLNDANKRYSYVWNNISKVDEGGIRPKRETKEALMPLFIRTFINEVDILKPDLIVFCCGPEYRPYLQEYLHLNHSSYLGKEGDKLEIVNSDLLRSPIKMYYSNHPRWLNKRDESGNRLCRVAKAIVDDYRPKSSNQ